MVARCGLAAHPQDLYNVIVPNRIGTGASPVMMLSERIGAMLLAQGEVRPLARKLPFVVTPEYLLKQADLAGGMRYPRAYSNLAFQYQLGTIVLDGREDLKGYDCVVVPSDMEVPVVLKGRVCLRADNTLAEQVKAVFPAVPGEVAPMFQLDAARGFAQIITPRTETFMLPANVSEAEGPCVKLSGNTGVSVYFACARDGKPLKDSKRVLVLNLTDLKASGVVLEPEAGKKDSFIVKERGTLPLLVRQNVLRVGFKRAGDKVPRVWALKYDGTRAVEVAVKGTAQGVEFEALAVTKAEVFGGYEVVWGE
jgi:hypothetical protein